LPPLGIHITYHIPKEWGGYRIHGKKVIFLRFAAARKRGRF